MSDLAKRLRIKAGMIEMGERIAWGSDSALMREAADALDHAAVERKKVGRPQIREVFMRNGAVIPADRDDLPDYVYESVFELLEMAAPDVQGEPDVGSLVEALEALLEVRVVEADASYGLACAKAEHALAAYRKGGDHDNQ